MAEAFTPSTIDRIAKQAREPSWVTDLRRDSLRRHAELPWPHPSDDIWRRVDVSLLDPQRGFAPANGSLQQRIPLTEAQLAAWTQPMGGEELAVRVNGAWLVPPTQRRAHIEEFALAAGHQADPLRDAIIADGLTDAEQKLSTLNLAFHHDDLAVTVPAGTGGEAPIRLVRVIGASAGQALFPLTVIRVGAGSKVTIIDEYVSLSQDPGPHLINSRIELVVDPDASVHYIRLQRWAPQAREFLLQRTTLGRGATLTLANINLGAALSKAHIVTKLVSPDASTKLYGFVFGKGGQQIDQHTLLDHQAPNTTSDLQFKAALQDHSRMVYTGLIRIGKDAVKTQAYQANHNLMLSKSAKAETIPMLEILADDVQCKHGASVGPIDDEQTFYLMSRGIAREAAQRLVVMGFIESIIQQVPFEPLQERLREEIEGSIHSEEAAA